MDTPECGCDSLFCECQRQQAIAAEDEIVYQVHAINALRDAIREVRTFMRTRNILRIVVEEL